MQTIEANKIKSLINATFPDYRKRKVFISVSETITLHDVNWSGGTRAEYRACTISGRPLETAVNMGGPAPWENPFEGLKINIPQGMVIAQGGYFCGKKSTLHFTINPIDQKLLPIS